MHHQPSHLETIEEITRLSKVVTSNWGEAAINLQMVWNALIPEPYKSILNQLALALTSASYETTQIVMELDKRLDNGDTSFSAHEYREAIDKQRQATSIYRNWRKEASAIRRELYNINTGKTKN